MVHVLLHNAPRAMRAKFDSVVPCALMDGAGVLSLSAQISDMVDECPYEGNLLSAVPVVTCMVTHKEKREVEVKAGPPVIYP